MAIQSNASDISIRKLSIRTASGEHNLNPFLQELSIYENMFQPALSANLIISDSHNMPYKLPIVGEETVDIDLSLTGFSDGYDSETWSIKPPPFHVNSITQREHFMPKAHRFGIDLISEKYMSSIHSKISRSYNNNTISDIVSSIYYNYLHDGVYDLRVEPTEGNERVVIPNLSPLDAINWLAKRAIPINGISVNYLYYETMHGSNFVCLNSLAKKEPIFTFLQRPRIGDSTGVEDFQNNEIKIAEFEFIKQFDKEENTKIGVYSSKLITHDIVTKKIRQYEYGGLEEWDAYNHCGKFPPLSNSDVETKSSHIKRTSFAPYVLGKTTNKIESKSLNGMVDSRVEFFPKHNNMYALSANDTYDNYVENWKLRRNNHIGVYDGLNIALKSPGNSGLRVGHTVNVFLPSPEATDSDKQSDNIDDKFLSGKYMVTAIKHVFSRLKPNDPKLSYNMIVEVSKDGYDDYVPPRKSRKDS
jgi:hypothetical protein